jgi:hypothetical protein
MLLSDITTNVKVWLGQHSTATTTLIEAVCNDEYVALVKQFFFDELDFSENKDSVVSTATLTLTTNSTWFHITSVYDEDNNYELTQQDEKWYNALEDPDETGTPENFVVRLGVIYLIPVPSAVVTYRVRGQKAPATLTSAQTPAIPADWHYVLECKTAQRIANQLGLVETMMRAQNAALSKISELVEHRTMRRRDMTGQMEVVSRVSVI